MSKLEQKKQSLITEKRQKHDKKKRYFNAFNHHVFSVFVKKKQSHERQSDD